jgi:hypothetical protein
VERGEVVEKVERRPRVGVVAAEEEIELDHAAGAKALRDLAAHVVGRRVRREREAVAQLVEREVLLDELAKLDHVGRVAAHAEKLVLVEREDLVVVVPPDHNRRRVVAVRHDHREVLADQACAAAGGGRRGARGRARAAAAGHGRAGARAAG